jgi:hypothetical protein
MCLCKGVSECMLYVSVCMHMGATCICAYVKE